MDRFLALTQFFQEFLRNRTRESSDMFGQVPVSPAEPFLPDLMAAGPGGMVQGHGSGRPQGGLGEVGYSAPADVFSKNEKWIGNPPNPPMDKWKDRESEVLGWAQYVSDLSSWAAQVSLEFGNEIVQASRWTTPIKWTSMTLPMRNRTMRLLAILRSTLISHPRSANLINAFMEGVDLQLLTTEGWAGSQTANGYELLRQLTQEFSLRTRSEALVFRTALAAKSFVLSGQETTAATVVTDTVGKIELEAARYQRLLQTLPNTVDSIGLQVTESDLLMVLVRSLPQAVRSYVLRHTLRVTITRHSDLQRVVGNSNRECFVTWPQFREIPNMFRRLMAVRLNGTACHGTTHGK